MLTNDGVRILTRLGVSLPSEFKQYKTSPRGALRQCREESHTHERCGKQFQRDSSNERRYRRICHITRRQIVRIVERRQLVAMKAVLPISENVKDNSGKREQNQYA